MPQKKSKLSLYGYIGRLLIPFWGTLLIMVIVNGVDVLIPMLQAVWLEKIIEGANLSFDSPKELWEKIAPFILLTIATHLILEVAWRLWSYLVECRMIPQLRINIQNNLYHRILKKPYGFFDRIPTGALVSHITKLTNYIPSLIYAGSQIFNALLMTLFSVGFLCKVHLGVGLLMLGWILIFLGLILIGNGWMAAKSAKFSALQATSNGQMVDGIGNILSIKLFHRHHNEQAKISDVFAQQKAAEVTVGWSNFFIFSCLGIAYFLMQVGSIFFLIRARGAGHITAGSFARVFMINHTTTSALWSQIRGLLNISKMMGESQQALKALNEEYTMPEVIDAKPLILTKGAIFYDAIVMHYPESQSPTINGLSLHIPGGQKVGIVGASGSGKSTLIRPLLGLYPLKSGRILLDDQPLDQVGEKFLSDCIGLVPQHPLLFHRSIAENIGYGKPGASHTAIMEAAKKAEAHDFIEALSGGYDHVVGEGGSTLSGGQKQRIIIARVILQNPKILVLDEATAALDTITERYIQGAMEHVMEGKTTLVIAHRLSTLLKMERILVMQKGKIIEDGSHSRLLAQKGAYYRLWQAQVDGFLGDGSLTL